MITVISPAKTLDYETANHLSSYTQPTLLNDAKKLIKICQKLCPADLAKLMKISDNLANLNYQRFQNWQADFTLKNARQALLAFKGDVYQGLSVEDFETEDFLFAQDHLAILSGLYGVLKPLDLMQPYRLEMGTKLKNGHHSNLYQFWGDRVTDHLNQLFSNTNQKTLINLASNEYFKVIVQKPLQANIIHPIFLDERKGEFKVISFYAKKARGLMARYMIKNKIDNPNDLRSFDLAGYQLDASQSNESQWFFKRSEKQAKDAKHNEKSNQK